MELVIFTFFCFSAYFLNEFMFGLLKSSTDVLQQMAFFLREKFFKNSISSNFKVTENFQK